MNRASIDDVVYLSHCSSGNLELVTYLINNCGLDVNRPGQYDRTPLHYACK